MTSLEALLTTTGELIDWPESEDLSRRVVESVAKPAPASPRFRWALVAAALLILVGLLVAIPSTRQAIADLLGVAGIRIELGTEEQAPAGFEVALGEKMTRAEAEAESGMELRAPSGLPAPAAIYLAEGPVPDEVSMVWAPTPDLPEIGDTGIGLLTTQFQATGTGDYLKRAQPGTNVRVVSLFGQDAFWLDGAPHMLVSDDGGEIERRRVSRLAANVLIWEERGVTYRIESNLDLTDTLAIANGMSSNP